MKVTNKRRYNTGSVRATNESNEDDAVQIGPVVRILPLNIEGISMAKCELLGDLTKKENSELIMLRETHLGGSLRIQDTRSLDTPWFPC